MQINKKIQSILDEAKEITKKEFAVFDIQEKRLAITEHMPDAEINNSVRDFIAKNEDICVNNNCTFIREDKYIIIVCSNSLEAVSIGRLLLAQIRNVIEILNINYKKEDFLKDVVTGNISEGNIDDVSRRLHLTGISKCIIFIVRVQEQSFDIVHETLKNLIDINSDIVTNINRTCLVLLKKTDSPEKTGIMLADTLQAEAMTKVKIGIGSRCDNLSEISESYKKAMLALKVGGTFCEGKDVFVYSKLGIGRLIEELSVEVCETFIEEVFNGEIPSILNNDENIVMVKSMFENDLNISEASRQLFLHRNTLVYRLDKFEKETGLDIRKFDDALTYAIVRMIIKHIKNEKSGGKENGKNGKL